MGGSNGVKRPRLRWMYEGDGEAHAFKIVDHHGRLSQTSLCGLQLIAMSRWNMKEQRPRCSTCQKSKSKGFRA